MPIVKTLRYLFFGTFAIAFVMFPVQMPARGAEPHQSIAIQPLGKLDPRLIESVRKQLVGQYNADVTVCREQNLPKAAYYPPRGRYRAEKLLSYLKTIDTKSTKVLGLTTVDISTTKDKYVDWGILGLGEVGGRTCVVSTFRMRGSKQNASNALFRERFAKVVSHELGHTYGLQHCPVKGCLMEDCKGTVKTVDQEHGFCAKCKEHLSAVLL